jgi:hypothetical protein
MHRRRPRLQVPKGYQVKSLGKSTVDFMSKKITLKDLNGSVIAEGVTRREALKIIHNREKLRRQSLL